MHSQHSAILLNVYLLSGLRQDGGWRTSQQKRAVLHVMFNNCDTTEQDVRLDPGAAGPSEIWYKTFHAQLSEKSWKTMKIGICTVG